MILIAGTPLINSVLTVGIEVRAEPIGDTTSIFLTLGAIVLIVVAAIITPSIWFKIRPR